MNPKIGDIFSVPIDTRSLGYGRVVEKYEKVLLYCVFYSHYLLSDAELASSNILLAGITAGAKIKNGDWPLIGNETSGLDDIKRPNFKVMIEGKMYVESLSGQTRRKIEEEEADILMFRSIAAPIRYEKALQAHFGIGDWLLPYDKLLYENIVRSQEIPLN